MVVFEFYVNKALNHALQNLESCILFFYNSVNGLQLPVSWRTGKTSSTSAYRTKQTLNDMEAYDVLKISNHIDFSLPFRRCFDNYGR